MVMKRQGKCEVCGKQYRGYGLRFCSYSCGAKWRRSVGTVERVCLTCGDTFIIKKHEAKRRPAKYCSHKCFRHSLKAKHAISSTLKRIEHKPPTAHGDKHYLWKGSKVGYCAVHDWIRRHYGYAKRCSVCGVKGRRLKRGWNIQWANISGEYKRDRNDYLGMCASCHKKRDLLNRDIKKRVRPWVKAKLEGEEG